MMEYKKHILLPLFSVLLCVFFFGIYGHIEFANQSNTVWKFAKHWSRMGAAVVSQILEKFANKEYLWITGYYKFTDEEKKKRFFLANAENTETELWSAGYMSSSILTRSLNELEKRYSNSTYRAIITDREGYVPTGMDRGYNTDSLWGYYTGDKVLDAENYSHRFFPYHKDIDKVINSMLQIGNTGYVGSQIIIGDKVWGYFIVSFDLKELKLIRDEIFRRIVLISLAVGAVMSVADRKL